MIDEVRYSFAALLDAGAPASGLSVRRLEVPGLQLDVHLGLDEQRRQHVLVAAAGEIPQHEDLRTVTVAERKLLIDGCAGEYVDVACLEVALTEVFDHFVVALLDRLRRDAEAPAQAAIRLLEDWQRFLAPGATPIGADILAPLVGELLILLDVVEADPRSRVDVWTGPNGARHDFRRGNEAMEVKVTRAHETHEVVIHGTDQLLEPPEGRLVLHLIRLEAVPGGSVSAPRLVEQILAAGASAPELYGRLAWEGLVPAQFPEAADVTFEVRERGAYAVVEGFPRIVPDSFVGGSPATGVRDLVYRADLRHATSYALTTDELDERTARIANMAVG